MTSQLNTINHKLVLLVVGFWCYCCCCRQTVQSAETIDLKLSEKSMQQLNNWLIKNVPSDSNLTTNVDKLAASKLLSRSPFSFVKKSLRDTASKLIILSVANDCKENLVLDAFAYIGSGVQFEGESQRRIDSIARPFLEKLSSSCEQYLDFKLELLTAELDKLHNSAKFNEIVSLDDYLRINIDEYLSDETNRRSNYDLILDLIESAEQEGFVTLSDPDDINKRGNGKKDFRKAFTKLLKTPCKYLVDKLAHLVDILKAVKRINSALAKEPEIEFLKRRSEQLKSYLYRYRACGAIFKLETSERFWKDVMDRA